METLQTLIENYTKTPENLLNQDSDLKTQLKTTHDLLLKTSEKLKQKNENLIIQHTDNDQIWEQLKLHLDILNKQHTKSINYILQNIEQQEGQETKDSEDSDDYDEMEDEDSDEQENQKLKSKIQEMNDESSSENDDYYQQDNKKLQLKDEFEDEEEEEEEDQEGEEENEEEEEEDEMEEEEQEEEDEDEEGEGEGDKKKGVNDSFEEMEKFLNQADIEDQQWEKKMEDFEKGGKGFNDDDEDMDDEDDLGSNYEFGSEEEDKDFFKDTKNLKDDYEDSGDEQQQQDQGEENLDDDEIENDIFDEQRENAMINEENQEEDEEVYNENEIERYEKQLMKETTWQAKGEIKATNRPVDSLVNENLDFKNNQKIVEPITQEYTDNLESLIKQRIIDEAFDDRQKIVFDQNFKENFTAISKEKSEKGLAELYEDQFKSSLGLTYMNKDDKLKKDILNDFKEVCYKLDALFNLNFTPKPFLEKTEIQASKMKINIDEKIPISVSTQHADKSLQDAFDKKEAKFQSKVEMTHAENNAERLKKKKAFRTRNKEKERKKMLKTLQHTGQTKHEYNLVQKAKADGKKLAKNKNQASVKFSKSGDFFKNLQNTLSNKDSNNKKNSKLNNNSKAIKKGTNQSKL